MEFEKQFDEQFKCIQDDCAGGGHTYPSDSESEGGQCQFCAEYLFPIKDFIKSQISQAVEGERSRINKLVLSKKGDDDDPIWNDALDDLLNELSNKGTR